MRNSWRGGNWWRSATVGPCTCTHPRTSCWQKLRWYQLGGGVSDRQWRDVLAIIRVQGDRLDCGYLRRHAPTLGVADLLERALGEST